MNADVIRHRGFGPYFFEKTSNESTPHYLEFTMVDGRTTDQMVSGILAYADTGAGAFAMLAYGEDPVAAQLDRNQYRRQFVRRFSGLPGRSYCRNDVHEGFSRLFGLDPVIAFGFQTRRIDRSGVAVQPVAGAGGANQTGLGKQRKKYAAI